MMNTETDCLKSIAEEIVINNATDNNKPNNHLQVEAKRLEKAIIQSLHTIENFTQRDTFHYNTLNKLVNICDILFESTGTINANVKVILDLLTAVKQIVPSEIRPNLKLPKAFVELLKAPIAEFWTEQTQVLLKQQVDKLLIDIASIPFKRFIDNKKKLNWGDFTWLKGYQAKLDIMDWEHADCHSKTEAMISLLIGRNFNDDRFYIYCKKYVEARTKEVSGKRNKLLEYAYCEKLVIEDTQVGTPAYDLHTSSVSVRLLKLIKDEIDFVETHEREIPVSKFEFKWNIETIAFFFKLLWDHKVFGKVHLERFSEQIAANCSSVGKDEFQAGSIYSRLYIKETEVVIAVEKLLAAMLADVRKYRN